jgi:DNA-binding transcriptional regulator LsrR (DeoR family)
MFRVEIYGRVRRAVLVEVRSQREVAREFAISRKTIQKMLRYAVAPGYLTPPFTLDRLINTLLKATLQEG